MSLARHVSSVTLHPLRLRDVTPSYVRWMNDPDVVRYLMAGRSRHTRASVRAFVRGCRDETFAIRYRGRHVGNVMLRTLDPVSRVGEVGILLGDRSTWGRGVASAAVQQLTALAFGAWKLEKLWAGTCNPAAARLFHRNGWSREGYQRRHVYLSGQWCDHWLFGLQRSGAGAS